MSQPAHTAWTARPERSQAPVVRFMIWLSLLLGRRLSRGVLHGIALYFLLFSPSARRALQQFYQRLWQRPADWRQLYRHFLGFSSAIHDRVFLLSGRQDQLAVTLDQPEMLEALLGGARGAVLLGAHFGSFELLRSVGQAHGKQACLLMYEENATRLGNILAEINPDAASAVIAMNQPHSMLLAREKLEQGAVLGMLADRNFAHGKVRWHDFLGAPAAFPVGPLRLAATLRCPVIFMAGIYVAGNRYHVHAAPLADFSHCAPADHARLMAEAQARYVAELQALCHAWPHNWFNFFDFWNPEPVSAIHPSS